MISKKFTDADINRIVAASNIRSERDRKALAAKAKAGNPHANFALSAIAKQMGIDTGSLEANR